MQDGQEGQRKVRLRGHGAGDHHSHNNKLVGLLGFESYSMFSFDKIEMNLNEFRALIAPHKTRSSDKPRSPWDAILSTEQISLSLEPRGCCGGEGTLTVTVGPALHLRNQYLQHLINIREALW